MDDQEFLDALYQLWAKTTGAEEHQWHAKVNDLIGGYSIMLEDVTPAEADRPGLEVCTFVSEDDAKFIAFAHSVLPEIVRRFQDALDEADRLDAEKDELIAVNIGLEMDLQEAKSDVRDLMEDVKQAEVRAW